MGVRACVVVLIVRALQIIRFFIDDADVSWLNVECRAPVRARAAKWRVARNARTARHRNTFVSCLLLVVFFLLLHCCSLVPMTAQTEETRWRSFRQLNRNRPFKQLRIIVSLVLAAALYGYGLLALQPQQSHAQVVQWSVEEAQRLTEERRRIIEQATERRRKKVERNREANRLKEEANRLRKMHANATTVLSHFTTNVSAAASSNSTLTSLTSGQFEDGTQRTAVLRFFGFMASFFASMFICALARGLALRDQPSDSSPARRSHRRSTREEREARFREWANRLNRQRREQGERPLSLQSLRLVMRGRDLSGNDYDALLQFNEEAGPAMDALIQSMGATQGEIERCPQRTLQQGDDLLQQEPDKAPPHCAVCLEGYEIGDPVRTIPCFHTFHTRCIDPWLTQKAVCPVCKHPALG